MSQAKLNNSIENWGEKKIIDHKYTGMYELYKQIHELQMKKININIMLAIKLITTRHINNLMG